MATATTLIEREEIEQRPVFVDRLTGYDLALSVEEAQTLYDLIYYMIVPGGRGEHLRNIRRALDGAGVIPGIGHPTEKNPDFVIRTWRDERGAYEDIRPEIATIKFNE